MGTCCTLSIKTSTLISTLVVLMLLSQQGWAGVYSCWGGCLNQCVLGGKKPEERLPCYWSCVAKCYPPPGQFDPRPNGTNIPLDSTSLAHSSPASEIPGSSVPSDPPRARKSKFGQKYYCIIGCSFQSCMRSIRGKTDLKTCLVRCNNKCKN
ncbi:putative thionin-like protein [Helianthus debilis subsp. tardiflorus]